MPKCHYCGTSILFGGASDGERRYCNQECLERGQILGIADDIPPAELDDLISQIHNGPCPRCQGPGPVDVFKAYQVWSALVLTSWSTQPTVCCRSCGVKHQLKGLALSTLLGWWGFPWGLVVTPVQITRNLLALSRSAPTLQASEELSRAIRFDVATQLLEDHYAQEAAAQPIAPH